MYDKNFILEIFLKNCPDDSLIKKIHVVPSSTTYKILLELVDKKTLRNTSFHYCISRLDKTDIEFNYFEGAVSFSSELADYCRSSERVPEIITSFDVL